MAAPTPIPGAAAMVRVRGVPFQAEDADILKFFAAFHIMPVRAYSYILSIACESLMPQPPDPRHAHDKQAGPVLRRGLGVICHGKKSAVIMRQAALPDTHSLCQAGEASRAVGTLNGAQFGQRYVELSMQPFLP